MWLSGVVLTAGGECVEDRCWLRKEDDKRHQCCRIGSRFAWVYPSVEMGPPQITIATDPKTVAAWLTDAIENRQRIKVGGLHKVLAQRRLKIFVEMVEVTVVRVAVKWMATKSNPADQLTRVPANWVKWRKIVPRSSGSGGGCGVPIEDG